MKNCKVCGAELNQENHRIKAGLICRPCELEAARTYRQTDAYKQVKSRYQHSPKGITTARAREERPEVAEKRRVFSRSPQGRANNIKYLATAKGQLVRTKFMAVYRQKPRQKELARVRDRKRYQRRKNDPAYKEARRRWRETYKGTLNYTVAMQRRNAQRYSWVMDTENPLTAGQWLEVLKSHKYRCHYCKQKTKLTIDHVIPLSKGGKHEQSNVVPACPSCNSKKKDKLLFLL